MGTNSIDPISPAEKNCAKALLGYVTGGFLVIQNKSIKCSSFGLSTLTTFFNSSLCSPLTNIAETASNCFNNITSVANATASNATALYSSCTTKFNAALYRNISETCVCAATSAHEDTLEPVVPPENYLFAMATLTVIDVALDFLIPAGNSSMVSHIGKTAVGLAAGAVLAPALGMAKTSLILPCLAYQGLSYLLLSNTAAPKTRSNSADTEMDTVTLEQPLLNT